MLFALNSPEDLFSRGFTRDDILGRTGVDIGYHGSKIRNIRDNLDRWGYCVEFVQTVIGLAEFKKLLEAFACGDMDTPGVYAGVGLGHYCNRYNLGDFCEALGIGDLWPDVKKREYEARFLKIRKTMVEHWGCEYSLQSPVLAEKFRAGMQRNHGVDYTMQSKALKLKAEETCFKHYNVRNSGSSPIVIARRYETMTLKYGAPFALQVPRFKDKQRATMTLKYGAPFSLQSPILKPIIDATVFRKYGVAVSTQHPDVKAKVRETNKRRYGVEYLMQSEAFRRKAMATKRAAGTFNSSAGEDELYGLLVAKFGESDVIRQYYSDLYPYDCDFYIKSRDMYIELNAFKGHNRHWFGSFELDDVEAAGWKSMVKRPDDFYNTTLNVWVSSDVEKRKTARENNLNYVVFWDYKISDAKLWFAMGCPDGHDWEREYSWLPDIDLYYDRDWPKRLTTGSGTISTAARVANWREFYKHELAIWNQKFDGKWGTIPARLYVNRWKNLKDHTLPFDLTNRELLSGFTISGMWQGYSRYDNSGMVEFLEKYRPGFVYDPCAGWGERMLTCAVMGIRYLGVDINENLMDCYAELMEHYGLKDVGLVCGDSSDIGFSHGLQDCVFTCPPYEGTEIYTDVGAENLDHDVFLKWWSDVVVRSVSASTKVFAYQINQECKAGMNQVLLDAGWRLVEQIPVNADKIGPMVRVKGSGSKDNFEEIQVFVR